MSFPNAAAYTLDAPIKKNVQKCQMCEPCVVWKAKRKVLENVLLKPNHPRDAESTDTTGPLNSPD